MTDPKILIDIGRTFTRSDGTVVARIYERLTKASRRKADRYAFTRSDVPRNALFIDGREKAYRRGVYDAYKHLQKELDYLV